MRFIFIYKILLFGSVYLLSVWLSTVIAGEVTTIKDNRWHLSYAFEQSLWRDTVDPQKAWGLFGQAGVSDANPNPIVWSVMGSIGGTSPIPGRERDKFGLSLFYVGYSSPLNTLSVFCCQYVTRAELRYSTIIRLRPGYA
jgi:Carbohydrate-selective porin, OprB family